jgi:vancomycin resistance protein YoaR
MKVNIEKTIARFGTGLYEGERTLPIIIDYSHPKIKEEDLRAHPPIYRLSAYTTYYGTHDSPNRIHNIKLISSWMDGTLMMPGDQFSVAEILGEVTEEQGFKEAFVIVKGELVPLLGGGACQIATTLYNAVAIADLKVLERRNHSFYFNIYPLGRDAGVYPEQLDFKFENDTPNPILIKTIATDRGLSFRLYGTPTGKRVKFSPAKIYGRSDSGEFIPMSLSSVIEKDVPFKTEIARTVYDENGSKIKEETILSRYKMYGDKENVPIKKPEPR